MKTEILRAVFYVIIIVGLTQLDLKTFLEAESEAIWVDYANLSNSNQLPGR